MKAYSLIAAFSSLVIFSACRSISGKEPPVKDSVVQPIEVVADPNKALNDSLAAVKADSLVMWDAFKTASDKRISDNEKCVQDLKTKIIAGNVIVKAKYQKILEDLEWENSVLKQRLAAYPEDKTVDMDSFKKKFTTDINRIEKSLKDITIR